MAHTLCTHAEKDIQEQNKHRFHRHLHIYRQTDKRTDRLMNRQEPDSHYIKLSPTPTATLVFRWDLARYITWQLKKRVIIHHSGERANNTKELLLIEEFQELLSSSLSLSLSLSMAIAVNQNLKDTCSQFQLIWCAQPRLLTLVILCIFSFFRSCR
jgi:hypothetical protein